MIVGRRIAVVRAGIITRSGRARSITSVARRLGVLSLLPAIVAGVIKVTLAVEAWSPRVRLRIERRARGAGRRLRGPPRVGCANVGPRPISLTPPIWLVSAICALATRPFIVARPLITVDGTAVVARLAAPAPLAPLGVARAPEVSVADPVALTAAFAPPAAVVPSGIPGSTIALLPAPAVAALREALVPAIPVAAVIAALARDLAALARLALVRAVATRLVASTLAVVAIVAIRRPALAGALVLAAYGIALPRRVLTAVLFAALVAMLTAAAALMPRRVASLGSALGCLARARGAVACLAPAQLLPALRSGSITALTLAAVV